MIRFLLTAILGLLLTLGWMGWRAESAVRLQEAAERRAKSADKRAADAKAELADARDTITVERARADALNDTATTEQEARKNAEHRANRLSHDLASGERRLRHEIGALYTAQLSRAAAAAGESDGAAERGADLVGAAVGVGAKCDARVAALIEAYELNRPDQEKAR